MQFFAVASLVYGYYRNKSVHACSLSVCDLMGMNATECETLATATSVALHNATGSSGLGIDLSKVFGVVP